MRTIFLKSIWGRRGDYIQVVLCGIFQVAVTFMSFSLGDYLSIIATGKISGFAEETITNDVFTLTETLLLFLAILVFFSYFRKRAGDYAMLDSMGIKKKHRNAFMICEYGSMFLISLCLGLLAGIFLSYLLRCGLLGVFSGQIQELHYGNSPMREAVLGLTGTYFTIFLLFEGMVDCLGIDALLSYGQNGGKAYKRNLFLMFAGVIMVVASFASMWSYWGKGFSVVTVIALVGGLYFVSREFTGSLLERLKKTGGKYYKRILWLNHWYHQFFYNMNMTFIIAAFLFIIMFSFFVSFMDALPVTMSENYPYDLVWMANKEDQPFIERLEQQYGVKADEKPCIRVCSGDCAEHTGISVDTYEEWTGKHLELEDDEIYVVYQRARADYNALGIDYDDDTPDIYIGCAESDLWKSMGEVVGPSNKFHEKFKVAGSENRILTGNFIGASYENIVVFSNGYYENARWEAAGANLAVMLQIPSDYEDVREEVYSYAQEHSEQNYFGDGNVIYEKKYILKDVQRLNMYSAASNGLNMLLLFLCALFIFGLKTENDSRELEKKYRLYVQHGIPQKKRKKWIRREVMLPLWLAFLWGGVISVIFTAAEIYLKKMDMLWNLRYISGALVCIAVMLITFLILAELLAAKNDRRIRRMEDE